MIREMANIELSTGAIFHKDSVLRVVRSREKVAPAEVNAEGIGETVAPAERELLLIEMKEGPAERVEGEHAAVDAAKLKALGFAIEEA